MTSSVTGKEKRKRHRIEGEKEISKIETRQRSKVRPENEETPKEPGNTDATGKSNCCQSKDQSLLLH